MRVSLKTSVKGLFRIEALKVKMRDDGTPELDKSGEPIVIGRRILADWFPNKLLNSGKNRMGSNGDWLDCCQVGTDNTTPQATDTGLLGYVAGTNTKAEIIAGAESSAPYFHWKRIRYRFDVGDTAANLSEVGVGWATTGGANLLTRALIVDALGNPTTVTPKADEILDVWYELRVYPPTGDVTGTLTLDGISYDYLIRASEVTSSSVSGVIGQQCGAYSPNNDTWYVTDGEPGDITQTPSGVSDSPQAYPTNSTYSANSYERVMQINVGPADWVLTNGIRCFRITTTLGYFQMRVGAQAGDTTIPKTTNYTMTMEYTLGWTEGTVT
jgi:hypothetical protein